jgi:hypothetical protein
MLNRFVCVSAYAGILGACAVAPTGGSAADPGGREPEAAQTVSNVPRIGSNAMSPAALAHAALTTDTLDATSAAAMGQTEDARTVLHYAVGCALDSTQSVTFSVGGTPYTFSGAMGIAPEWTSGALSESSAAWVSACLFARTNLTATAVWVSARGADAGLATTVTELDDYQIEEGAFWGNAFGDLGPISAHSCNGVDQASDDSYGDLPLRQCAQWDGVPSSGLSPCGMHYAGLCSDVCTSTGTYAGCAAPGDGAAAEVITTMLYGTPQ